MNELFTIPFIILHLSFILTIFMLIIILKRKDKTQLSIIFMFNMVCVLIWTLGQILLKYYFHFNNEYSHLLICLYFIGVCFLSPSLLITGIIYHYNSYKVNWKTLLILLPGIISYIVLCTSPFHNLFIINYSFDNSLIELGSFFIIHNIYTYAYIVVALFLMITASLKSSGFFSKQSLMIISGILFPLGINVLVSYRIVDLPTYMTPVAFSIGITLFLFSSYKYNFLDIMPIVLDNIFDQLTDAVIVINKQHIIIELNSTAIELGKNMNSNFTRNMNFITLLKESTSDQTVIEEFEEQIIKTIDTNIVTRGETNLTLSDKSIYVKYEIANVIKNNKVYCTTILINDITELKNRIDEIRKNQQTLMEKDRLASLGNLIGGIAHNLKTPIMTISGVAETLEALGQEYYDSIDDKRVTKKDHKEISLEIVEWSKKISPYCSYMSEMISAVKGQSVQLSSAYESVFTLRELINRINMLMKYELKKFHCDLKISLNAPLYSQVKGDLSSLVQVFNNFITNSIQSYQGKSGTIEINISQKESYLSFDITDTGSGMSDKIQERLFKEMVTTKGKNGTGLGMYMAHSTIRAHFHGQVSFTSKLGEGTQFNIKIPIFEEENSDETE